MTHRSPFQRAVLGVLWLWAGVLVLLPALMLSITSVLTRDESALVLPTLTLEPYRRLLDPLYAGVLLESVRLAGIATLLCLLIGYPFAWALSRQPARYKPLLIILLMVPFWTNSLVRTFALKLILATRGVLNSTLLELGWIDRPLPLLYNDTAVTLGLVYVMLPFMILPLYAVFEDLRRDLLEASRDLGAQQWQTFRHVILPLTMPGILAGTMLVFLPSLGSFYVADVLGGARVLLVGNIIKNQFLEARDWPFGAAVSITLTVMMGILLLGYHACHRHGLFKTRGA